LEEVADFAFVCGDDAFDEGAAGAGTAGDEDLTVEAGGDGLDVRHLGELSDEGTPIPDAVAGGAHEFDVGGGADKPLLEVAAHAVGDGEGDDEGSDSGGDANDGDCGDEANDGLTAAGTEVAGGDEEFETHWRYPIGLQVARAVLAGDIEGQICLCFLCW